MAKHIDLNSALPQRSSWYGASTTGKVSALPQRSVLMGNEPEQVMRFRKRAKRLLKKKGDEEEKKDQGPPAIEEIKHVETYAKQIVGSGDITDEQLQKAADKFNEEAELKQSDKGFIASLNSREGRARALASEGWTPLNHTNAGYWAKVKAKYSKPV